MLKETNKLLKLDTVQHLSWGQGQNTTVHIALGCTWDPGLAGTTLYCGDSVASTIYVVGGGSI